MKWKCNACVWGPCVYESASDDDYLMSVDICPRGACITRWQKMSVEEPEQKGKIGLPDWLRVGNFVVFHGCNTVCRIEGYDTEQKILSISRKVWREDRTVKDDVHCGAGWGEARVVFPNPYTFETAPVVLKVRRKGYLENDLLQLFFPSYGEAYFVSYRGSKNISFSEILRDYEQLDGWPCGTFDGEDEK